ELLGVPVARVTRLDLVGVVALEDAFAQHLPGDGVGAVLSLASIRPGFARGPAGPLRQLDGTRLAGALAPGQQGHEGERGEQPGGRARVTHEPAFEHTAVDRSDRQS